MPKKILIVDDSPVNIIVLAGMLKALHVPYDSTSNGKEALERINDQHYALIIMDLEMPVMNGYETVDLIRKNCPNNRFTPVIALTATDNKQIRERCKHAGFSSFLCKPITKEKLKTITSTLLPDVLG